MSAKTVMLHGWIVKNICATEAQQRCLLNQMNQIAADAYTTEALAPTVKKEFLNLWFQSKLLSEREHVLRQFQEKVHELFSHTTT